MDHTYDNLSGLDQARHNSTISMARSMRVAKQERSLVVERDEKPRKQRKRALVAVSYSLYLDHPAISNPPPVQSMPEEKNQVQR